MALGSYEKIDSERRLPEKERLMLIENEINDRYTQGISNPQKTYSVEVIDIIPADWNDFIEHAGEVFHMSEEEDRTFMLLCEDLAQGYLAKPGREEDFEKMISLKQQYDSQKINYLVDKHT